MAIVIVNLYVCFFLQHSLDEEESAREAHKNEGNILPIKVNEDHEDHEKNKTVC